MTERLKEIEKMISRVMKKRDLTEKLAIEYMLGVATGRLAALWRYEDTLPEGKSTKGILSVSGRKKRAEKVARISTLVSASAEESDKPAKKKPAKKKSAATVTDKPAKKKAAKKRAKKTEEEVGAEIVAE